MYTLPWREKKPFFADAAAPALRAGAGAGDAAPREALGPGDMARPRGGIVLRGACGEWRRRQRASCMLMHRGDAFESASSQQRLLACRRRTRSTSTSNVACGRACAFSQLRPLAPPRCPAARPGCRAARAPAAAAQERAQVVAMQPRQVAAQQRHQRASAAALATRAGAASVRVAASSARAAADAALREEMSPAQQHAAATATPAAASAVQNAVAPPSTKALQHVAGS